MVAATLERLMGREAELRTIRAFLEASAPDPLVFVGEPGIGKTTLWAAAVEAAADSGFRALRAQPEEAERDLTYAVLADLASPLRELVDLLPPPQRRALMVALLLEDGGGVPPDARAVGAAFLTLLGRAAETEPLVIAVDDLQWVDAASGLVLRYALRRLDRRAVRVLIAIRAGEPAIDVPDAHMLRVAPLGVRELDLMFRVQLGTSFVAPTLRRIADASAGNPLYALELARELLDRATLPAPSEPLPVPADVRTLIGRRLQSLPRPTRAALEIAAALAGPTRELVEAALGAPVDLAPAVAAGVIADDDDDEAIRFGHPLYASVVLGALGSEERRGLHRRLAEIVDDTEERARQLAAALEQPDEAVAGIIAAAAERARGRGALTSALGLAERAVELTPADSPAFVQRVRAAAGVRFDAGDAAGAEAALSSLASRVTGEERARVLLELGTVVGDRRGLTASAPSYREALDALPTGASGGFVALLHARLALASRTAASGDAEADVLLAEQAVALAEDAGDPSVLAEALAVLAHLLHGRDNVIRSDLFERALALEIASAVRLKNSPALLYAQQHLARGDAEAALPLLAHAAAAARSRHDPALSDVLVWLGWTAIRVGDTRHAAELAEEAHEVTRLAGRGDHHVQALPVAAMAYSFLGDVDACRRAAELATRSGESPPAVHMALGLLELSLGNFRAARDLHLQGWREATSRSRREEVPTCVEAMATLGEVGAARRLLESEWEAGLAAGGVLAARFWHARGVLAGAEGDTDGAVETLKRALAAFDGYASHPVHRGRVLLALGTLERRLRQRRRARETFEAAQREFARSGAAIWEARATDELTRVRGRPSSPGALTPMERQIAGLVARGRSNAEVARELHLSAKTVEWNLTKIYRKLLVRSRTELAAKLAKGEVRPG